MAYVVEPEGVALDGPVMTLAEQSFDRFYEREFPGLVRLATGMCGSRAVAEELVQDAMVKVLARWRRVRDYERPGAFARRLVLNAATSQRRRRRAEERALARVGARPATPELSREAGDFWRAVRQLPNRQSQVITLFYVEDRPVADIAALLEIAEGTVRATLHQARTALARTLDIDEEEAQ